MNPDQGEEGAQAATARALLAEASRALAAVGVAAPQRDARLLLRWAAGWDGARLAASEAAPGEPVEAAAAARFRRAVAERATRRPLSQITGAREFFGRRFAVSENVLDPRPESETLAALALELIAPGRPARILDLGVGSGCLILSVLAERPQAHGIGVDVSEAALAVAAENARAHDLAGRLDLRLGDWLAPVAEERFDLILCNPPYIPEAEMAGLEPEVTRFEPRLALTPGADGLAVYRKLAPLLADRLAPGGAALFEVGRGQAEPAAALFRQEGLDVETRADLGGVERAVLARA